MPIAPIPMPIGSLESFSKGFHMTDNLMNRILSQKKMAQQNEQFKAQQEQLERHFQANLGLSKAAAGRAAQAAMDEHRIAEMKLHPMNALKEKIEYLQSLKNQQGNAQNENPTGQQLYPDLSKMFSGEPITPGGQLEQGNLDLNNRPQVYNPEEGGISTVYSMGIGTPKGETLIPRVSHEGKLLSPDEARDYFHKTGEHMGVYGTPGQATNAAKKIHEQQANMIEPQGQAPSTKLLPGGIDPDDIIRGLTYQAYGLKVPTTKSGRMAEPPEIKAKRDFDYKMKEKKYEHELKMSDEETKKKLKEKGERDKVILAAKNDIPHLETSLRSLEIMKKIADDPKNDDMFGHWWLGNDRAAQRISNPNAGIWQTEGLGPIVDAEMKMSSKGNVVALKAAQANKPNFGEKREVAAAKLDSRIKQVKDQIKKTKEIAGTSENDFSKMSTEQLMAMAGGG